MYVYIYTRNKEKFKKGVEITLKGKETSSKLATYLAI